MFKRRYVFIILLLISNPILLKAQEDQITLRVQAGHNSAFGGYGAASVETLQTFKYNFGVSGGVKYSTVGKISAEARPLYFHEYEWGRVSAETLFAYTNLTSVNSMSIGAGVGVMSRWIGLKLGYYYRLYGRSGGMIKEPFNIYYDLCINLLSMIDDWDLQLTVTNSELFELERHYQPSFIAQCSYCLNNHLGLSMGIGCRPAGMFNMSADYYESYLKLGVCYRW